MVHNAPFAGAVSLPFQYVGYVNKANCCFSLSLQLLPYKCLYVLSLLFLYVTIATSLHCLCQHLALLNTINLLRWLLILKNWKMSIWIYL